MCLPSVCSQKVSQLIAVCMATLHSWFLFPRSILTKYLHGYILERSMSSRRVSVKTFCNAKFPLYISPGAYFQNFTVFPVPRVGNLTKKRQKNSNATPIPEPPISFQTLIPALVPQCFFFLIIQCRSKFFHCNKVMSYF